MNANALARLKRLAGESTLILTHYGRKSGNPYEGKIWFVVDGDKVFIGIANIEHQWIKNVQKNPRIKLSVDSAEVAAGDGVSATAVGRGIRTFLPSPVTCLGGGTSKRQTHIGSVDTSKRVRSG